MLEVRFSDCMGGWITLTVKFDMEVKFVEFSARQEEAFSNFLQWLETLVSEQGGDFWWDAESSIVRCQYKEGVFTLSEDDKWLAQCPIDRMELVRIFYEAFILFTRSDEYRPRQWLKWGSLGANIEADIKCLLAGDEIIEFFLGMNGKTVVEIGPRLNPDYRIRFLKETSSGLRRFGICLLRPCTVCKTPMPVEEPNYIELPIAFEDWDYSKQKKWLENCWDLGVTDWGQLDLRELRSAEIEQALQRR